MAELWEWVEVYILFQTAVMDETTAKNKNGGGAGGMPACLHYLKLSQAEFNAIEITLQ